MNRKDVRGLASTNGLTWLIGFIFEFYYLSSNIDGQMTLMHP